MGKIRSVFVFLVVVTGALFTSQARADTCTVNDIPIDCGPSGGGTLGGSGGPTGGGDGTTGQGENGDPQSVTQEQKKGVVEQYKLPCKNANESPEAYSGRALAGCIGDSTALALQQYRILRYLPGGTAALVAEITQLCTTHVSEQISAGNVKSC